MLIDILDNDYKRIFPINPSPYISEGFINLVEHKVDRIVRLVDSDNNIGLVAGIKDNVISAPFSAPFGGFHFKNEQISYDRIYDFIFTLKQYIKDQGFARFTIKLPPNIYNPSVNTKTVNAFIRQGFTMDTPDIESSVDLRRFGGKFSNSGVRHNCNKALRYGLTFSRVTDDESIQEAFDIVSINRKTRGRNIYMSLQDLLDVNNIFPVDFFLARDSNGAGVGASVLYRGHDKIVQGIFMGDLISARKLYPIDFLYFNVFNHYKALGYDFIDLGSSSSAGEPNMGLIRFKESHDCISTLGYTFSLSS